MTYSTLDDDYSPAMMEAMSRIVRGDSSVTLPDGTVLRDLGEMDTATLLKVQVEAIDWRQLEAQDRDDCLIFKRSGISAVVCTGYAAELFCIFGPARTSLFGFYAWDNPTSRIGRDHGGHDFAVLDDRYIVDPWLDDTVNESKQIIFDLELPEDQTKIRELYGERCYWQRNVDLEKELQT